MPITTEARKPLYAVVGAGDLAVENIKDLPTQFVAQAATLLPRTTALFAEIPGKAFATYGTLAQRGEQLVRSIRKQSATESAKAAVKTAKTQAKAATTSATKAAGATAKAVSSAAEKIG